GDSLVGQQTTSSGGGFLFTTGASGEFLIDVDQSTLPPGATFTTGNFHDADFGASFGLADAGNNFGYTLPTSLDVAKTSDATPATQPGDQINYTITVTNPGSTIQSGVVVTDPLPVGTSYVSGSTTGTWFEPSPAPTITEDWETTDDDWIGGTGWVTDRWTEVGETNGSNGGDIRIESENGSTAVRIQDNDNGGEGVQRSADLSAWASATLAYDFDRDLNDSDDYVMVLVSTNGSPFTEIERYTGPANDSGFQPASLDLTPYMGANTLIRFLTGPNTGGGERVYFDNIRISGEILTPVAKSNATGAPDPLVDGVPEDLVVASDGATIPPGGTLTVTYSVTVDDPAPATSVVNTVTASSNQSSPDTATVIDPLNVASIADFVWEDLDADGVQDPGEPGLAGVTVELLDGGVVRRTTTTASDGSYRLAWLSAGNYEVRFSAPAGFIFSPADSGGDDAADSDSNVATGVTGTIALAAGQNLTNVDAGLYQLATIGDLVWDDLDADGIQDSGEPGLGGITVDLLDSGGVVVDTTTTAADGSYSFSVVPDTYSVRVAYPADGIGSPADQGGDDAVDSDADPSTGETSQITVASGEIYDDLDVGVYTRGILGDFVFDDLNGNGIQDVGEIGIAGATVELLDGGAVVDTTTTGVAGDYAFTDIEPRDYTIRFTTPTGYRASPANSGGDDALDSDPNPATGETGTITVISGTDDDSIDAGFYVPARLGDLVFVDADSDGIQDPGELGAAGLTVNLLDGSNAVIATTTTATDGTYGFADLDPGLYRVEVLAPGFSFTSRDQGADDTVDSDVSTFNGRATVILSGGGDDDTIDAGILPAIVGDFVWEDLDGDGVQDAGEPGVGGVTVNLLDSGGLVVATVTTAADGSYSFGVGPGTYELEFVAPAGTVFTPPGAGTPSTDSNANPATGRSGPIVITDDSGDLTIDAGLYTPIDLGDRVWEDLDADGVQDAGESGLAGVTVQLRNSADVVIATTTTNGTGLYAFNSLVPGDYSVVFTAPAGYQLSPSDVGGDDTIDSDPATGTGVTSTVSLVSGVDDDSVDAGMYRLGSIGDRVWVDLDSDGLQDAGEPGLAGVTVNVRDAGNSVVGSAVTAADGSYLVSGLTPADYTVEFIAPGYTFVSQDVGADDSIDSDPDGSGTTGTATVVSGAGVTSVDAGVEPIVVGDFAFVDTDGDGVQDAGEPGLGGVVVELLVGGSVTQTTATAADGSYSFDVAPGTYEVRFTAPAGYEITAQDQGGDDGADSDIDQTLGTTAPITVPGPNDDLTVDAGFFLPASVGDLVWDDLNADGVQDAGEPGIDGVVVELRDGGGAVVSTTTTAGGGLYSFTGLTPGNYTVTFLAPVGASPTTADAGGDDALDSDIDAAGSASITLLSNEFDDSIDAGFVTPASVGDLVWDDLNGDGVRDAGEPGLGGVPVDLLDGSGTVVASTTSAADGSYTFSGVDPGSYRVRFGTIGAFELTDQDQGGDDTVDSDADPVTGETALFTVISGESNPTLDAGLVAPASLGDTVWFDADANGVQDAGEPGVPGLAVQLLDGANSVVATDTTDASGTYGFTGLEPGDYSIRVVGAGLVFTAQDSGGDDAADSDVDPAGLSNAVTLVSGDVISSIDAGIIPSSIGDRVFEDLDGDGQAEPGEPGLSGVTIELLDDLGAVLATTTSAADGSYLFDFLLPADYQVRFTAPVGYDFTAQDAVGDAVDSDADGSGLTALITLPGATDDTTVDAGLFQTATLGDFVWDDLDGNGVQDVGEPGIDGITVELRDSGGTLVATTTTAGGGAYNFTNLNPGSYTVTFVSPGAAIPTPTDVGGDDSIDSDIDAAGSVAVSLTSNQTDTSIDAGFFTPATVGDRVWDDLDGDGIQGVAEPGFGGVNIDLLDGAGVVVATTTSAGDGSYSFTGVAPGDYRVRFTPSGIYGLTDTDQGSDDSLDSDADVVTGETAPFTVSSGDVITSVDAGLVAGASIGDLVWFDIDGDGVQDPGEPGVPAVTVELLNSVGAVVGSTLTLADGSYSFGGLAPGDYSIRVPGAGFIFTSQGVGGNSGLDSDVNAAGASSSITLTSGLVVSDLDAGILPSSIGDFVWEDTDGNGVQDGGEPGLSGVTVELLDGGGSVVATDTTTISGAYEFDLLLPGTYSVRFTAPSGFSFISANAGADDTVDSDADGLGVTPPIALPGNTDDDTLDGGLYRPVAIGNFVWDDLDGDGVQDAGESGLDGVVVELRDGAGTLVATSTTALGFYSFASLVPGDYTLTFIGLAGSAPTAINAGSDDALDSDIDASGVLSVSLPSGTNDMTFDAGFVTPATIGNFVWDDLDGDGVQDLLEPGLAGVPVELLDGSGAVIATTTSAADGSYGFTGVEPGTYSVRFGTTGSYDFTGQDQTGNDLFDSDADPISGETAQFSVVSGETQDSIDAGLIAPASLGDRIWFDIDSDGVQDAGEPGAPGLTIQLLDAGGSVLDSTTSGAGGGYSFVDLAPGDYSVRVVGAGLVFSGQNVGADDSIDSDVNATGRSDTATLISGQDDLSIDAGILPSSIGDFVFVDVNGNGLQDAGEPGLPAMTIELLNGAATVIGTTVSAADGSYSFDLLLPGDYQLRFTAPVGYEFTEQDLGGDDSIDSDASAVGLTATISLPGDTDVTTVDAGLFELGSISDFVWDDLDADGIQDSGEPGIAGVAIELRDGTGTVVGTTTTAADGSYSFTSLRPGDFTVTFSSPAGAAPTATDSGADDLIDSDIDASGVVSVSITTGEDDDSIDAGFVTPASIGDFVWDDLDGDGIQAAGEPGVGGVTVELLDGSGTVVGTTLTAADGSYGFSGLTPGQYRIRVTPPAGTGFSAIDLGGDDDLDSDVSSATGESAQFTLVSGESVTSLDAGLITPASIGDRVWYDLDGDGIQDAGEPGAAGLAVSLTTSGGAVLATTTTDASGAYSFTGLAPGDYVIVVDPTLTFTAQDTGADDDVDSDVDVSGSSGVVNLVSGENDDSVDAGVLPPAVGDFVWTDLDGDGIQNAGEPGLGGVTVELLDSGGSVIDTTVTAADGSYLFDAVVPGTYSVQFTAPATYQFTTQDVGGDDNADSDANASGLTGPLTVTPTIGSLAVDAGLFEFASVGDFVWDDLNANGVQDVGEPGLSGVVVELTTSGGATVSSTTTAADGSYSFTSLVPGDYVVTISAPVGYAATVTDAGGDDDADSDVDAAGAVAVTLSSNEDNDTVDGGFVTPATIGDFVWDDLDGDGVQDAAETGIVGVIVELLAIDGTVLATTTTVADGSYAFTGVAPGTYRVRFTAPGSYDFAPANAGADDALDSDADQTTGETASFTVESGEVNDTIDAGVLDAASIGDRVWIDADGDGVQDAGEPGAPGLIVQLLDAGGAVAATTTTAADGSYQFTGLLPGSYSVRLPDSDLVFTGKDAGADDAVDSDADGSGVTDPVTIISGENDTSLDVGVLPSSIGDFVWTDTNADGIQDVGEPGLAGVTIELLDSSGTVLSSTTSAADGSYRFDLLLPGDYLVRFSAPAGYRLSPQDTGADDTADSDANATGETTIITLTGDTDDSSIDAGLFQEASLGDRVWVDLNVDGIQSPGEPGVSGLVVNLVDAGGTVVATDTTDGSGAYQFSGVVPGDYTVEVVAPGYTFVPTDAGSDDTLDSDVLTATGATPTITVASAESNQTVDAGVLPATIGDLVWDDLDGDGVQDAGEPGIGGVTINLLDSGGTVIDSTTSAPDGSYGFAVPPGSYEVEFVAPPGSTFSAPDQGGDDSLDSDADATTGRTGLVTLSGSESDPTLDAGIIAPASIGDTVFQDYDGDGSEDVGDIGLDGVTVNLIDGTGSVAATVITAAGGQYNFTGLEPGTYRVDVVDASVPAGYLLTTVDPLVVTVVSGQTYLDADFGYEPTGSIEITKGPGTQAVVTGGNADFTITVTNTGASAINNVSVSDPLTPGCDQLIGTLAAGASTTYTCTLTGVTVAFTNSATVVGEGPGGIPLTDSDTADVTVEQPGITITKNPANQTVVIGGTASFSISVTNTGDTALANVTVSDPAAPLCDNPIGSLAVGETVSYTCDLSPVSVDFTNTASVVGDDPIGNPVSATDSADVDVISPAIQLIKNPASQSVVPNGTASFTITVTNTGDAPLSNVTVSDPLAPNCDTTIGALAIGQTETINCSVSGITSGFTNTATAVGEDPTGSTVTDDDTADVLLLAPSVGITKDPANQTIITGSDASFTITVVNNGDAAISNVTVTDPQAPNCDNSIGTLAIGASVTYNCVLTGVGADFTNTATVDAEDSGGNPLTATDSADVDVIAPSIEIVKDPASQSIVTGNTATFSITVTNTGDADLTNVAVSDPLAPACDQFIGNLVVGGSTTYSCDLANATSSFVNVASVAGEDPTGGSVTDSDTAQVTVLTPSIEITKNPADQQVLLGEDATFSITVTNTGDANLSSVEVTDPQAPNCDNVVGDLPVGAAVTYTCVLANVTADFTNSATVSAEDPQGGSITDSDNADVDVINPSISIVKDPASQSILTGTDATFTITVTNTGDVALTDVTVSDGPVPSCDNTIGDMAVGASVSYSCTLSGVASDFVNTAQVVGTDPIAGTVSDSDTAAVTVLVPGIGIEKTTSTPQVILGGTASFDITVTNTGTAPLTNVQVSDPLAPDCDIVIGALAAGESTTYTCSLAGMIGDITNQATVTGDDASGTQISDSDTEPVDVISPEILVSKTPNDQTVIVNGTATFTITVTNVGDVPLTGVSVSDPLAPNCDRVLGDLAASSSVSFSCTLDNVAADFTNTVTASGTHPVSGPVQSTDTADVTILTPGISISKTAVDSVLRSGSDAVFDIIVSNSGQTDLTNVVVTDGLAPGCDNSIGVLPLGAVVSYSCTQPAVTADFVNIASVTGSDAVGNLVSDDDNAAITVIDPTIEIEKTPDLQQLLTAETATFTITVTNPGDVTLTGVSVTDPLAPDCDRALADLPAGGSESYNCSLTNVVADFTNVASVEATDPLGDTVSDSDDALVDVVNPGIDIEKTPDTQTILTGEVATFTITVTNNGDQDIVDAVVIDPLAANCDSPSTGPIAVGASISYLCDSDALTADLVNIVSVDGTDVLGNAVSDSDDASVRVISPGISIDKTPDAQAVVVGGTADFTITVANSGDSDLDNVTVSDLLSPDCDAAIGTLPAGSSTSYSCVLSPVPADFTNTASVIGDDELGNQYTADDTADVTVLTPALDVTKDPALQIVNIGDDATFTISVTNSGQTPLTNVSVSDPLSPTCDNALGALAVGQTVTYTCVANAVTADFVNTATGTGEDPLGRAVTGEDSAIVDVIAPAIDIEKTPDTQNILAGSDATFTVTVTNTGDSDLSAVDVTDAATPACDLNIGDLSPGDSVSYTCIASAVSSTFTNVADVVGTDPGGSSVTDSDDAVVDVTQIGTVSGLVFLDREADGLFNNADVLLPGVPVDLIDGGGAVIATVLTDGSGEYNFVDVPVGNYTVDVFGDDPSIPAGSLLTTANDPQLATVVANTDTRATDTGYAPPSTLSGRAFTDDDADGVDSAEPGIGAVIVSVWEDTTGNGVPDTVIVTVPTASDGTWLADGLPAGTYAVEYTTPPGLQPTFADLGGDDTVDSDIDPATGLTPTVALGTGDSVGDLDAGYFTPGSIGDLVFADPNGNAVRDSGEVGLAGIDIVATWAGPDGVFATGDDQVYSETTVAGGAYLIGGLPGGRYSVEILEPLGSTVTTGNDPIQVTIAPGGSDLDADFGLDGNGILSGTVYSDLNNDGVRDGAEPGIAGVTIALSGVDLNGSPVNLSTTTDASGDYSFTSLDGGVYTITETQPAGFLDGIDSLGSAGGDGSVNDVAGSINLPVNGNGFAYDFGEVAPSSISGLVQTVDGDPIDGVTITLAGTDDLGAAVTAVTVTASDGSYSFGDLRPGTYTVTETQPPDYGEGGELAGSAGGVASL
ncbi:MAG: SdrD B-like domain-containing protein, partial [Acidimicrobiales bacterium]